MIVHTKWYWLLDNTYEGQDVEITTSSATFVYPNDTRPDKKAQPLDSTNLDNFAG